MRGQQTTFKPNFFKNVWKHKDRFSFEQTELNTSVHNAEVIDMFHWSFLQLPTILMVSILGWITVCMVNVCISYKTINFLMKPLNQ